MRACSRGPRRTKRDGMAGSGVGGEGVAVVGAEGEDVAAAAFVEAEAEAVGDVVADAVVPVSTCSKFESGRCAIHLQACECCGAVAVGQSHRMRRGNSLSLDKGPCGRDSRAFSWRSMVEWARILKRRRSDFYGDINILLA